MRKHFSFRGKTVKGFSLIELLIVIAILALIIIIAIWVYRLQLAKGWDARRKADLDKIRIAVEEYEKDHDCYPPEALMTCSPGTGLKPYIIQIPCDPRTKVSYTYEISSDTCPHWFRLYSILDNQKDPIKTKINCENNCGPDCAYQYYVSSGNTTDTTSCAPGTSTPSGTGTAPSSPTPIPECNFLGCVGGVCVPIDCFPGTVDPVCTPNYSNRSICEAQCADDPVENNCKQN